MSLINEALKKAQRVRHEDPLGAGTPPAGGGTRITKRGQAHSANTMVLLGSGALVLVILSVVATVYLVNREPAPPAKPPAPPTATAPDKAAPEKIGAAGATDTSSQLVVPIKPSAGEAPPVAPTPTPVPPAGESVPSPAPVPATPAIAAPAPGAQTPPPPAGPAKTDPAIAAFVESIKVAGIRSSGSESRVLMNERVYRVNDVVERTLGLKLIKVAADSLTFSDPSGAVYEKHF